jgi:hypothetical protein
MATLSATLLNMDLIRETLQIFMNQHWQAGEHCHLLTVKQRAQLAYLF